MTLLDPAARSEPLTEDQIEIEWMRWNLPADSGDAMAFYRLGEPERIRKAFVDGLLRGAAVVAQSPIPAARLEPIPGGVAEKQERVEIGRLVFPPTFSDEYGEPDLDTFMGRIEALQERLQKTGKQMELSVFVEVPAVSLPSSTPGLDPTDPGHDVEVLRQHVRHLERRVRELHAERMSGLDPIRSSDGEVKP